MHVYTNVFPRKNYTKVIVGKYASSRRSHCRGAELQTYLAMVIPSTKVCSH